MARITYQKERDVEEDDLNLSILEISLKNAIPHVHACGGHARCSTCRVLVRGHLENVLPRNDLEQQLAAHKGFEDNIRLACQTRISGPVVIRRLVLDDDDIELALVDTPTTSGKEMEVAVLFSDIRNFTPFSESHLGYDIVHILNRYFHKMGEAILRHDGYIDNYMGDGIMAVFGLKDNSADIACEKAILAGLEMVEELPALNRYLQSQFEVTFDIGVGIHSGAVILGEMGHPRRRHFTAIGDVVNVASRIETATKQVPGAKLLVSDLVLARVHSKVKTGKQSTIRLKGKSQDTPLTEIVGLTPEWHAELHRTNPEVELKRELDRIITRWEAPLFLRLAFHDAIAYDPSRGIGGADGSIHFPEEWARPEHAGVQRPVEALAPLKQHNPDVSWADLIALAGAMAVYKCRGPDIWLPLGRTDAPGPDISHVVPGEFDDIATLKRYFAEKGFSTRDFVALSGAHTLGRARGVAYTEDLFTFSNRYFTRLLRDADRTGLAFLPSDLALLQDPECKVIVDEYATDEQAFFRDFAIAYRKMSCLGTSLFEKARNIPTA